AAVLPERPAPAGPPPVAPAAPVAPPAVPSTTPPAAPPVQVAPPVPAAAPVQAPGRQFRPAPPAPPAQVPSVTVPPAQVPPAPVPPVPVPAAPVRAAALPEAGEPARDRRVALAVALPPALLTLALCLYGIQQRQLWRDEHASWWAATLSWGDLGALTANMDLVLAPYYVLLHLWVSLFGDSEAALRIPSALAMAGAAAMVALLGRRLLTPRLGALGGLLFAVCPSITWYGQDARPYAFAVLAAAGSTLLLTRIVERPAGPAATVPGGRPLPLRKDPAVLAWVGYGATVVGMGLTHLVTLMILPGHLLLVVQKARRSRAGGARWVLPVRWAVAMAGAVLLLSPLLLLGAGQSGQIAWNDRDWDDLGQLLTDLAGSAGLGWTLLLAGVIGAVSLLVLRQPVGLLACWAVVPVLVTVLTAHWLHLFLARYLLFTVPAWTLLAAAVVGRLPGLVSQLTASHTPPRWVVGPAPLVVAFAVVAVVAWPSQSEVRDDLPGEMDARAGARVISAGLRPGDGVVFDPSSSMRRALAYELRGLPAPKDTLLSVTPQEAGSFGALECEEPAKCLAGVQRIWLLVGAADKRPYGGVSDKVAKELKQFHSVRTENVPNLRLVLLERNKGKG
ncbi:glycosyltransferase family 39 protein, partial [Kitasatospora herbaricolor]|uniref:glycosyltransferase family 39 protein n=1 Tax=Kitasatospora herbaricolor TaxID=68217 RepID=UPI0036DB77A6